VLDVLQRLVLRSRLPAQLCRRHLSHSQLPDFHHQAKLPTCQAAYECYQSRDGIVRHAALESRGTCMHADRLYSYSTYSYLLTVPPTSVEAERAFSSAGVFNMKLRSRLKDKSTGQCFIYSPRHWGEIDKLKGPSTKWGSVRGELNDSECTAQSPKKFMFYLWGRKANNWGNSSPKTCLDRPKTLPRVYTLFPASFLCT
jgi:hypothetical protein